MKKNVSKPTSTDFEHGVLTNIFHKAPRDFGNVLGGGRETG